MRTMLLPALALSLAIAPGVAAGADPEFGSWWWDGRAELDGYRLEIARYGEIRQGECVMIFVTEPFSDSRRVKVDDPARDPDDTYEVLKLNLVRDFQTGIYDYNTMVSVFARSADFEPVKITFTSAEWCGQVYDELIFRDGAVSVRQFSYFDGESGVRTLSQPERGISEDNLFILLRGLRRPFLAPGVTLRTRLLPSVMFSRLSHVPLEWQDVEIEREAGTRTVTVPAGTFEVGDYVVRGPARVARFSIETAYPHRIVRWSVERASRTASGPAKIESGELTGTARLAYWKLNQQGGDSYREQLGLGRLQP